jgi:type II secretory pathway component PulM
MSDAVTQGPLASAFAKMTDRERKLVMLTGVVAVVLAIAGASWMISSSITRREKQIATRKEEIAQLETLRGEYEAATARQKAAETRIKQSASTSLFTLMQKAASDVGLSLTDLNERRLPVKDSDLSEVTVDVTLKDISIDKLVTLLEKIEGRTTGGVVKVTKLKTKTMLANPEMLEVVLTVSTWRGPTVTPGAGGAEVKTP